MKVSVMLFQDEVPCYALPFIKDHLLADQGLGTFLIKHSCRRAKSSVGAWAQISWVITDFIISL